MSRLQRIDNSDYKHLRVDDSCYYYGEYTAQGGFRVSETNNQIHNLKKKPGASPAELHYKQKAVAYWSQRLGDALNLSAVAAHATIVPAPPSKPLNHPAYDNRMLQILQNLNGREPGLDIRALLVPTVARVAQHEGGRLSPEEIMACMAVDQTHLANPLRKYVIVFDDVFTQGSTFAACRALIERLPGVQQVDGIFLAKTVWQKFDFTIFDQGVGL